MSFTFLACTPPPPPFELAAATLCAHGSGAITRFSFLSHVEHTMRYRWFLFYVSRNRNFNSMEEEKEEEKTPHV